MTSVFISEIPTLVGEKVTVCVSVQSISAEGVNIKTSVNLSAAEQQPT